MNDKIEKGIVALGSTCAALAIYGMWTEPDWLYRGFYLGWICGLTVGLLAGAALWYLLTTRAATSPPAADPNG